MKPSGLTDSRRSVAIASVGLAVTAFGVFQTSRIHLIGERCWVLRSIRVPWGARLDGVFAPLIADVDKENAGRPAPLGFTSDLPEAQRGERYQRARYALLPHSLSLSPDRNLVVAWLVDPAKLAGVCARDGLEPVHVYGPDVALLRKSVRRP